MHWQEGSRGFQILTECTTRKEARFTAENISGSSRAVENEMQENGAKLIFPYKAFKLLTISELAKRPTTGRL